MDDLRIRDVVAWLAVFGFAAAVEAITRSHPHLTWVGGEPGEGIEP